MTPIPETSFRFPSYRMLKRSMGAVDAVIDANELALRRFLSEAEKAKDVRAHVIAMAERYGTQAGDVDLEALGTRVRHLYVVSAYQQAEEFLRRFRDEHPGSDLWKDEPKLSLMENVLRNIGPGYTATEQVVGKLEIDLFDYYRQVRNRFLHVKPKDEQNAKGLAKTARRLRDARREHGHFFREGAPHEYHEVSHDDFVLFTTTIRQIALRMCIAGRPSNEEIVRMVERLDAQSQSDVNLKVFKKYEPNPGQLRKALTRMLRRHFSLTSRESEPVVDLLLVRPPLI